MHTQLDGMTRTQLADRAAAWFALAIVVGVYAAHFGVWPALLLCWLFCRWGVARVIMAVNADA